MDTDKKGDYVFREIMPDLTHFVSVSFLLSNQSFWANQINCQGSVEHYNIGVQLISNLVIEMKFVIHMQLSIDSINHSLFFF